MKTINKQLAFSGIFFLQLLIIAGCKNGNNVTNEPPPDPDNQPPGAFIATVDTTGLDPVVSWEAATDPDGDRVTYRVFLEGEQVQSDINGTSAVLEGLEFETEFTGRVEASDGNGGNSEASFTFTSREIRIEWQTSLGGSGIDRAESIVKTADGGFIVGGISTSSDGDVSGNNGSNDFWIVKLDGQGSLLWETNLGGSGSDRAFSIQETADEGFIVGGTSTFSDGDVSGNNGNSDYWIVRLDGQGNLLWETNLGGKGNDVALSIGQTFDGGFIIGGASASSDGDVSNNKGIFDYWIVKLDPQGSLLWETNLGGSGNDQALSISQTTDGGFIVGGVSTSSDGDVSENNGDFDYWVVRLDGQGNIIWETSLGGSDADIAFSIQQTSDGGFAVGGSSESLDGDLTSNNGNSDFWIVRLDGQGNLLWETSLGGSDADIAFSIQQTTDGGFIVSGQSESSDGNVSGNKGNSDFWIVKLNGQGSLLWETNFGGNRGDEANSIQQTADGGFIVVGNSRSMDGDVSSNKGSTDYWIVKLR